MVYHPLSPGRCVWQTVDCCHSSSRGFEPRVIASAHGKARLPVMALKSDPWAPGVPQAGGGPGSPARCEWSAGSFGRRPSAEGLTPGGRPPARPGVTGAGASAPSGLSPPHAARGETRGRVPLQGPNTCALTRAPSFQVEEAPLGIPSAIGCMRGPGREGTHPCPWGQSHPERREVDAW